LWLSDKCNSGHIQSTVTASSLEMRLNFDIFRNVPSHKKIKSTLYKELILMKPENIILNGVQVCFAGPGGRAV
jgi:hypothetical protein